ncbi:MAG: glycosyltransferase [Chloroflexi bacterium]|nr:MAG: glycosyltransferase [Chloroflexota bacterium]
MRIHQMTAALVYGDAITNDILEIDARLKAWGHESRIYGEHIEPRLAHLGRPQAEYEPFLGKRDDVLIYHYSLYTSNLELYRRSSQRKLVVYHNITPPEFFHGYHRDMEAKCRIGRQALPQLQGCDLAVADSDYNRRELVQAGIPADRTDVLPPFMNLAGLSGAACNPALAGRLRQAGTANLLFVGRVAPNKALEDLIKVVHCYRQAIDPHVRLWLVGAQPMPVYARFLQRLIVQLGLAGVVELAGQVSLPDLKTYYQAADLFVCASRHEGFGVPLLESMAFDVPVLARSSTAVPDTLGQAGVLFHGSDYGAIAEAVHLLLTETGLRRRVIDRQRRRLGEFAPEQVEARLRQALQRVGVG